MAKKSGSGPRPGGQGNVYDQTRKLILTDGEIKAGYSIETCIGCEAGKRRVMATCDLCGGTGLIKVNNSEDV